MVVVRTCGEVLQLVEAQIALDAVRRHVAVTSEGTQRAE